MLSQRIIGECTCVKVASGYMYTQNYKYDVLKQKASGKETKVTESCLTPVILPIKSYTQPVRVEGSICTLTDFNFYKNPITDKEFETIYTTFISSKFSRKQACVLITDDTHSNSIQERCIKEDSVGVDMRRLKGKTAIEDATIGSVADIVTLKASTQELLILAVKVAKAFAEQNIPIKVSEALDVAEKLYASNVRILEV